MRFRFSLFWFVVFASLISSAASAGTQEYPIRDGGITVDTTVDRPVDEIVVGDQITLTGTGFEPGSTVILTLDGAERGTRRRTGRRAPTNLGSAVADASGTIRVTVRIPEGLNRGTYQLAMTGPAPGGGTLVLGQVVEIASTPSPAPSSDPSTSSGALPNTGSNTFRAVAAAAVLVVIGASLLMVEYRRESALA